MTSDLSFIEPLLGSALGITILGWVAQAYRSSRREKDLRLKNAEDKIIAMDRSEAKSEESLKRIHYRIDEVEKSQNKLETKIDQDIRDLKNSLDKLTNLVIKALQHAHHHSREEDA